MFEPDVPPIPPEIPEPNRQDVVPPHERGEDPGREDQMRALASGGDRAMTAEERAAVEHDAPAPPRVYAPAEARTPRAAIPADAELLRSAREEDDARGEEENAEHAC